MPYTTLVAGTTITASWANQNVRDQGVTPFASISARTSAITAQVEGMLTYRRDAKVFEWSDGSVWRPMVGANLARAQRVTASSTTTGEIGVIRLDNISVVPGHLLRIWTAPLLLQSTAAADLIGSRVRVLTSATAVSGAATPASPQIGATLQQPGNATSPESAGHSVPFVVPAGVASISVLLTVVRIAGSGSVNLAQQCDLLVDDLGPDPGDTGIDL